MFSRWQRLWGVLKIWRNVTCGRKNQTYNYGNVQVRLIQKVFICLRLFDRTHIHLDGRSCIRNVVPVGANAYKVGPRWFSRCMSDISAR